MPHDPELVAETRGWTLRAHADLAAADHDLKAEPPLLADVTFHAQQAAEKSFKAFLTWHSKPFRKTHNLEELGEQSLAIDPGLQELIGGAVRLSDYAWKFRYPGEPEAPGLEEALAALSKAREVFEAVIERLPPEVRPT